MPKFIAGTPAAAGIKSVKLDGKEVLHDLMVKEADTDEGYIEVMEFDEDANGRRRIRMSEWEDDPAKGPGAKKRHMLTKRLTGKVEVGF